MAMQVQLASAHDGSLLTGIRAGLAQADQGLMCVAFASQAGVQLLRTELQSLGPRGRLVVTTAFGSTSMPALQQATRWGTRVRVLNPGGGTYHPKLYLGLGSEQSTAVIGSANLTGGLVCNVELATVLRAPTDSELVVQARHWAERAWDRAVPLEDGLKAAADVGLPPQLFALISAALGRDPVLHTLGSGAPNEVVSATPSGLYVHTVKTRTSGRNAQLVPAWMIQIAWDYLHAHGQLTNPVLLNHLRVHRSSAVLALLARLDGVRPLPGRPIGVRLDPGDAPRGR